MTQGQGSSEISDYGATPTKPKTNSSITLCIYISREGTFFMDYPQELKILIHIFKKLPGVGQKTAERFVFELLKWPTEDLVRCGETIQSLHSRVSTCSCCGCLMDLTSCRFCERSGSSSLCIVASARDVYSIEATRTFFGFYHVIEHLLSPLEGRCPSSLRVNRIEERIQKHAIQEVVIAFDSTLEGDATALYLKTALASLPVKITRLAFGIPLGSSLDHIDEGTLSRAFSGRQQL